MKTLSRNFLTACAVFVTPQMVSAGDRIAVRAVLFPSGGPAEEFVVAPDGKGPLVPVAVPATGFSEETELPRAGTWRLGHRPDPAAKVDEIAIVEPPAGDKAWLVLLRDAGTDPADVSPPDDESTDGESEDGAEGASYQVRVIDADVRSFGGGSVLVVNFAKVPIEIETGGKTTAIAPDGETVIAFGEEEGANQPVKFLFIHNDRKRPFVATNWSVRDNRRRLAVVLPTGEGAPPKVVTLDDLLGRDD